VVRAPSPARNADSIKTAVLGKDPYSGDATLVAILNERFYEKVIKVKADVAAYLN